VIPFLLPFYDWRDCDVLLNVLPHNLHTVQYLRHMLTTGTYKKHFAPKYSNIWPLLWFALQQTSLSIEWLLDTLCLFFAHCISLPVQRTARWTATIFGKLIARVLVSGLMCILSSAMHLQWFHIHICEWD
jgi:hypothetical protein